MSPRLPEWLRNQSPLQSETNRVREVLGALKLHTVCLNARCPNRGQCYGEGTATFLILGAVCTRNCKFCSVGKGPMLPPEADEPERVAKAAVLLGLQHVVITSVTRDDLPDGGAGHFAETISQVRSVLPLATVEVLTPDFQGNESALKTVVSVRPDIYNHNMETVPRLYPVIRPQANYQRSLNLLKIVKQLNSDILTKSGIMVGLGETKPEVAAVMDDLRAIGCDILTIGQYLQPTRDHMSVVEYIPPEDFKEWEGLAYAKGFQHVASGPLVRSSFHAGAFIK